MSLHLALLLLFYCLFVWNKAELSRARPLYSYVDALWIRGKNSSLAALNSGLRLGGPNIDNCMSGRVLGRSDIRKICMIVTGLNLNHTQYWWPMTAQRHMTRFFCDSWASCVDRVTTVRLCNQVIIYRPNTVNCTDILQQLCCNTVVAEWTSSGRRTGRDVKVSRPGPVNSGILGPDLQNILRQCYDYLMIMPKLRSTYDWRLIYQTSYNEWKAFRG